MKHALNYVLPIAQNDIHNGFQLHTNKNCMTCVTNCISSNGYYGYQKLRYNNDKPTYIIYNNNNKFDNNNISSNIECMEYEEMRRKRKMQDNTEEPFYKRLRESK